jgi:excisionase family DNA binding protein
MDVLLGAGTASPSVADHEVLTSTEVCEMLHISRTTLYKLIGAGKIPRFRVGSDWRFRKDLILRWMAERTVG